MILQWRQKSVRMCHPVETFKSAIHVIPSHEKIRKKVGGTDENRQQFNPKKKQKKMFL